MKDKIINIIKALFGIHDNIIEVKNQIVEEAPKEETKKTVKKAAPKKSAKKTTKNKK